jgi:hypothetical protein
MFHILSSPVSHLKTVILKALLHFRTCQIETQIRSRALLCGPLVEIRVKGGLHKPLSWDGRALRASNTMGFKHMGLQQGSYHGVAVSASEA